MKAFSLYVDKKTFVHQWDTITKICYIVCVCVLPAIGRGLWVSFFCIGFSVFLLLCAGVFRSTLRIYGFVSLILLTVVLIQGLFWIKNETLAFHVLGLSFYKEGLLKSLHIVLRVLNLVSSFLILMFTTKPSELGEDLIKAGLSPRMGYVIVSVFQIIPQMMATIDTIVDAQRSRGLETEGSVLVRAKAFLPLLVPVVINSFNNTKERAMALEVRAFSARNKKTFIHEREPLKYVKALRAMMALVVLVVLLGRIVCG